MKKNLWMTIALAAASLGTTQTVRASTFPIVGGGVTAFWDPNNQVEHVIFETQSGHMLQDLWYGFDGQKVQWHATNLTGIGNCNGASCSDIAYGSTIVSSVDTQGTAHVYFVAPDKHIHHLVNGSNPPNWRGEDLNANTNIALPLAPTVNLSDATGANVLGVQATTLVAYGSRSFNHVFYVGADHYLHEAFQGVGGSPGWGPGSIPAALPFDAVDGRRLTGTWDGGNEHVIYWSGKDNDLHDLMYDGSSWGDTDISSSTFTTSWDTVDEFISAAASPSGSVFLAGYSSSLDNSGYSGIDNGPAIYQYSYNVQQSYASWSTVPACCGFFAPFSRIGWGTVPGTSSLRPVYIASWEGGLDLRTAYDNLSEWDDAIANTELLPYRIDSITASPLAVMSDPSWLHAYYVGVDSHLYEVFSSDGVYWNQADLYQRAPGAVLAYP